jgi:putative protease
METRIGEVTHYFNRLSVAVLDLSAELKVGDTIHFVGNGVDFTQPVDSLELEHQKVQSAGPIKEVALQVAQPVHKGAGVFKIS